MAAVVNAAKSYTAQLQAWEVLRKADTRDFKQEWSKGKEEFHLKLNGYTEYIISWSPAARIDSQYSVRIKHLGREEILPARLGDLLDMQLRATFREIAELRTTQKDVVLEAIKSGALLEHVSERDHYSLNAGRKGVLFGSMLPDTGAGAILVRGDLVRDMNHPEQRLVLEVTWRSSLGTGRPIGFVVDKKYGQLFDSNR